MKALDTQYSILLDFVRAVQAVGIYPETHFRVQEPLARLHRSIRAEARRLGGLNIGFFGGQVVIDQFPFLASTPGFARLAAKMAARGIEKIAIGEAITLQELKRFVYLVTGIGAGAAEGPWKDIVFGRIEGAAQAPDLAPPTEEMLSAPMVLAGAADVLKDLLRSLASGRTGGDLEEGRNIVAAVMKGLREEEFLIDRMIRLQSHDDYTVTHSLNVCVMVVAQANRLRLSEAAIHEIGLAALLHDIGKELVPAEILNKPGRLDAEEFSKIALHPVLGAGHLRKLPLGTDLPMIVCFEHHIRYNGSGYPKLRFPETLHPASLMTQVADVYDALRTYRPYRPSLDKETSLAILREGRGTEFDPCFFDNFLALVS